MNSTWRLEDNPQQVVDVQGTPFNTGGLAA